MTVTINGTAGITTPAETVTANLTVGGNLGVTGATTLAAATATSMSIGGTPVIAVAPGTSGNILKSNGTVWQSVANSGTGTVTSITAGTGLTGGTITTSGTIGVSTTFAGIGTYAFLYYSGGSVASGASVTSNGINLYPTDTGLNNVSSCQQAKFGSAWGIMLVETPPSGFVYHKKPQLD